MSGPIDVTTGTNVQGVASDVNNGVATPLSGTAITGSRGTEVANPVPGGDIQRYTSPAGGSTAGATTTTDASTNPLLTQEQFTAQRTGTIDENAIRESTRKSMRATIDAIDAQYANLINQQQGINEGNLGATRAVNARSGLLGSDFGNANIAGQKATNQQAIKALEDEKALKLAEVNDKINQSVKDEVAAKKLEAAGNADAYATYLANAQTKASGYLESLAKAGVDLDKLGTNKAVLFKNAGLDEGLGELLYNSMKPKANKIDYKAEKAADGKILMYGVDPVTGELKTQRIDFDVPEGYEPSYVDGKLYYKNKATGDLIPSPTDTTLYTPDYKNYLLSKKEGFTGTFNDWQNVDANRKRSVSTTINNSAGLTPYQQFEATTNLQKQLASASQATKTVQNNYNNMKSAYDRLASGQAKDLNATSQAIINNFNKINDPNSVVRESEYARSGEGQSLLANLEGKVTQLQQGGAGLTQASLKEFVDLAKKFTDNSVNSLEAANKQAVATAKAFGLDVGLVNNPVTAGSDAGLSDEDAYKLYLQTSGGK